MTEASGCHTGEHVSLSEDFDAEPSASFSNSLGLTGRWRSDERAVGPAKTLHLISDH
jgi:hypothetical protein